MKIVLFYHSLLSDWNHGNAHFLRGIATELLARGHDVRVFEPADAWSYANLLADRGEEALRGFAKVYPALASTRYDERTLDLDRALHGADLVLVHEWNSHELVRRIGAHHRGTRNYTLLFHDTHHRSITDPASMSGYELEDYDGVLVFGEAIREVYLRQGWSRRVWTWHEAADTRVFRPREGVRNEGDLVWIGNWGDDERTAELHEFLIEPSRELHLRTRVYGVRYPEHARAKLSEAGIDYRGWLPNYAAPEVFAAFRATVHVPRRPYATSLPGVPTIRVFEALASGIPLVSAPWHDSERLFHPGEDFLVAPTGDAMRAHLRAVLNEPGLAAALAAHGLKTIRARHTCAHRVDELLGIYEQVAPGRNLALAEA